MANLESAKGLVRAFEANLREEAAVADADALC